MPPIRTADDRNGRPRQDPVSCQLCRSKKLRCDRLHPCSNCQSRKVTCEYKGAVPRPPPFAADPPNGSHIDYRAENEAIRARLRRLEETVFGESPPNVTLSGDRDSAPWATAASTPAKPRNEDDRADEDSNWLESIGTRSEAVLSQFTASFNVNICTLEHFLSPDQRSPLVRTIDIPTYDVAMESLNAYAEHLDAVQHIMHVESTRRMIDNIYAHVQARQTVDPGALSFILSLCANVGFYWSAGLHHETSFFKDPETAVKLSSEWTKHALLAMEQARIGVPNTSLESIQASIMLMFLLYHMEGFTFRVRMMHASSVAMARDLGIHKTDMPGFQPQAYTQAEIIEREVRRKLWWHMACTDWFLAFIGGPHEGMYSIHPRHMNVEIPRNITREDLNIQGSDFQRSLSEPTVMSYYLQRVRLAGTCRDISDALYKFSEPADADYDIVRMLDAKFETQLQDLPRYLRFDLPTKQLHEEYGDAYSHQTSMQAIMINLMISTRRCKLHLPYLIRAKNNPKYAFSRRIGLQSARAVFNVRRIVMDDESSASAAHLKLGGIRQHVFYATTVLVMDVSVNRNEEDPGQLAEVREALKIVQEGRDSNMASSMGDQFYDSLMAVLRKHHVKLPNTTQQARSAGPNGTGQPTIPSTTSYNTPQSYYPMQTRPGAPTAGIIGCADGNNTTPTSNPFANLDNDGFAFDGGMWADFLQQAPRLDAQDWDALMTDLDMRLI